MDSGLASSLGKRTVDGLGVVEYSGSRRKKGKNTVSTIILDDEVLAVAGSQPRHHQ